MHLKKKSRGHAAVNAVGTTLPSCPVCKQNTTMFQKIYLCVKIEDNKKSSISHTPSKSTLESMEMSATSTEHCVNPGSSESGPMDSNASENQLSSDESTSFSLRASNPPLIPSHYNRPNSGEEYAMMNQPWVVHQYAILVPVPFVPPYFVPTNIDTPMPPLPANPTNSPFAIDPFQRSSFGWQDYGRSNSYCHCYECTMSRRNYHQRRRSVKYNGPSYQV